MFSYLEILKSETYWTHYWLLLSWRCWKLLVVINYKKFSIEELFIVALSCYIKWGGFYAFTIIGKSSRSLSRVFFLIGSCSGILRLNLIMQAAATLLPWDKICIFSFWHLWTFWDVMIISVFPRVGLGSCIPIDH